MRTSTFRFWLGLLAVSLLSAAVAKVVSSPAAPVSARRDWANVVEAAHVGDAVCAGCHAKEAERHAETGHSRTLDASGLCDRFPDLIGRDIPDPERSGHFRFECGEGRLLASHIDGEARQSLPIQFAIGSGKHAVTFLTLLESDNGEPAALEHRLSLYPRQGETRLTPSHAGLSVVTELDRLGRTKRGNDVTTCLGCHSTTGRVTGTRVDDLRAGVDCESCHGPGRAHVAAATATKGTGGNILFGKAKSTAQEELHLCGRCHRSTDNLVSIPDPDDAKLARFQPVGLSQSACFRRSAGALKCTTCHDPHLVADISRTDYNERCVQCHKPGRDHQVPCTVEPAGQCTACHMPAVEVHRGIRFHDHWIRKRPAASK